MFAYLAAPGFQPFTIAALVLLGLCAVEGVSLLAGHSISGLVDSLLHIDHPDIDHPDIDHPDMGAHVDPGAHASPAAALDLHGTPEASHGNYLGTFYDWLNAGRVPLLILLMAGLGAFAVAGLVLQTVAMHALPAPLPGLLASAIAFLAVIPTTRTVSRWIARFLPRDETYAIEEGDLIGLTGVVTLGPVEAESAGRAKVEDRYGNAHFPRVRAARAGLVIAQGAKILVVDRIGGELTVIPAELRALETTR
ncbi:MAG TPA: OB-fold-containig protein [Dongiaceae bacterium]|nr:OB-fold-containig protein [Dongiaceae bacterium]